MKELGRIVTPKDGGLTKVEIYYEGQLPVGEVVQGYTGTETKITKYLVPIVGRIKIQD